MQTNREESRHSDYQSWLTHRIHPDDYADALLAQEPLNGVSQLPAEELPEPSPNQTIIYLQ